MGSPDAAPRACARATERDAREARRRSRVGERTGAGLRADEAFLIAVKRMGSLDTLSRDFAREHSDRLWKQLGAPSEGRAALPHPRTDAIVAFCLAVVAALFIKAPG